MMPLFSLTAPTRRWSRAGLMASLLILAGTAARGAVCTWVGGNGDWADGDANNSRWNPADEPDADDQAVFNTPSAVRMVASNAVSALTLSGGAALSLNGKSLSVAGAASAGAAGTALRLDGTGAALTAQTLSLSGGAALLLGHQSRLTSASPWTLPAGVSLQVKNGSTTGAGALPASTSAIAGGALTQTGGSITVDDDDGTLQVEMPFTATGGSITVNGHVRFWNNASLGGAIAISGGAASVFGMAVDHTLHFTSGSSTVLTGNLRLEGPAFIAAGAVFSGPGTLSNQGYSDLSTGDGASIGVPLEMSGNLLPGGTGATGAVTVKSLKLAEISSVSLELKGSNAAETDRIIATGPVQLTGTLNLMVLGDYDPAPGTVFEIISAPAGITGRFLGTLTSRLAAGKVMELTYGSTFVRATVHQGTHYDQWILRYPSLSPADRLRGADPDLDGLTNLAEFALNSDPQKSGSGRDRFFPRVLQVEGEQVFTLTIPVRYPASRFPAIQPPGELIYLEPDDNMRYRIQAGDTVNTFTLAVEEVDPVWSYYFHYTLPPLEPEWRYMTFRSPGPVTGDKSEFMRVLITP